MGMKQNKSNKIVDGKPSADQLPEEICKMLEERVKAQAATDLEYALTCFEMDEQGTLNKIKDVNFDPHPTTSTSEVKIDQSPPASGVTRNEFPKMIREFFEIPIFDKFNKLMGSYRNREEKKSEFTIFPQDASASTGQPQYGMLIHFKITIKSCGFSGKVKTHA